MTSFTPAALNRFLSEDDGEPVVMLNLLRFRPDGGRQRYLEYLSLAGPLVARHGAEILYAGDGATALAAEPGQAWDAVALVRYPSRRAFADMIADPDYTLADPVRLLALAEAVLQPVRTLPTPRTWFITGVSRGRGRQMAEQLLARGERVAGTARRPAALDDLKAQHGDRLWLASLDVTDTAAVRRVVGAAFAPRGPRGGVGHKPGDGELGGAEELTDEQIVHQVNTNLIGSMQVIRAALPLLRAQGGGRIIQVSSEGGQTTYPNFSLYHATKWGIEGFVEAVAQEVAPFGIEFTLAEPGSSPAAWSARRRWPPTRTPRPARCAGPSRPARLRSRAIRSERSRR